MRYDVFFSSKLRKKHPALSESFSSALATVPGVLVHWLEGTKDIWCRDYLPVSLGDYRFLSFSYKPDYLNDAPELTTDYRKLNHPVLRDYIQNPLGEVQTGLVLDGGNIAICNEEKLIFSTEVAMTANQINDPETLTEMLGRELPEWKWHCFPVLPGDVVAHIDGMLQFMAYPHVALADFEESYPSQFGMIYNVLTRLGFIIHIIPHYETDTIGRDGIPSAEGGYINFVCINGTLLLPQFRNQDFDAKAAEVAAHLPGVKSVVPIDCSELAIEGGGLHCICTEYPRWKEARADRFTWNERSGFPTIIKKSGEITRFD